RSMVDAAQEGSDGFECLSGSFHGILHDPASGRTVVLTDRLASRPLFLCRTSGLLCLSSDIRCLLALPMVDTSLDLEGLVQLVRFQMILEDLTLYRSIQVLPPATWLSVDHTSRSSRMRQYWALTSLPPFKTQEEAIESTAHTFRTATRRMLDDSDRVSVLLSGGLDSRMLIACLDDAGRERVVETH